MRLIRRMFYTWLAAWVDPHAAIAGQYDRVLVSGMGAVTESWQDGIIMAKEYDTDAGYAVCIRCV